MNIQYTLPDGVVDLLKKNKYKRHSHEQYMKKTDYYFLPARGSAVRLQAFIFLNILNNSSKDLDVIYGIELYRDPNSYIKTFMRLITEKMSSFTGQPRTVQSGANFYNVIFQYTQQFPVQLAISVGDYFLKECALFFNDYEKKAIDHETGNEFSGINLYKPSNVLLLKPKPKMLKLAR